MIMMMLFFTVLMFMAGNYVDSVWYYWDSYIDYSEKMVVVNGLSTDEDYRDIESFYNDMLSDESLIVMPRTPQGRPGLSWICTLGFEMG